MRDSASPDAAPDRSSLVRPITRRGVLRVTGAVMLATAGESLLAACGATPGVPSGAASTPSGSGATPSAAPTAAPASAAPAPTATLSAAVAPANISGNATAVATTGPANAPTGAIKRGGTLVAAQEVDPVQLDADTSSNFSALQAYEQVYESLTGYNARTEIVPALATSWDTPDPKTYIFHLRSGVKFHDGTELTADDVAYSIERGYDPQTASPWRSLTSAIKAIKVKDKATVEIDLSDTYPGLLGALAALRNTGIMPKDFAKNHNTKLEAVGTGPFRLAEYVPTDHLTYQRNPSYWDPGLPYLDTLTYKIMLDQNARIAALRAGQIKYAFLDAQGADQLKGQSGINVLQSPSAWLAVHPINVKRKPFDNVKVRQALRWAVDINEVIQKAVFGAGVPSGPIAAGFGNWGLPADQLVYTKADIPKAKQLLAEAGYPNGFKTSILCSPQYPEFVATSLVCQNAWKQIGVDCQVKQVEWGTYVKQAAAPGYDYDIGATAFTFRPDPDGYVYSSFVTGKEGNNGYSNPKVDKLLTDARSTLDNAKRKELYDQAQKILLDDVPFFWWYVKNNIDALTTDVQGYQQSFTGRRIFFKTSWIQ